MAPGGGPTQAEIIEEQAAALAELRDFKARAKLRLKEAAARLREYRGRADALVGELAEAKRALEASELKLKKKEQKKEKKPAMKTSGAQTDRLAAHVGVQTEKRGISEQGCQTEGGGALRPVKFDALPFGDTTSAAIDAELAMSDSEEEEEEKTLDEIASAIDDELGVSDGEPGLDQEQEQGREVDAIGDAIDAELATSDSEDEETALTVEESGKTAEKTESSSSTTRAQLLQSIDDEIDAELASSSGEEPTSTANTGVGLDVDKEDSSSSSSDSSESSDSSDDEDDNKENGSGVATGVAGAAGLGVGSMTAGLLESKSLTRLQGAETTRLTTTQNTEHATEPKTGSLWLAAKQAISRPSEVERELTSPTEANSAAIPVSRSQDASGSSETEEITTDEAESMTEKSTTAYTSMTAAVDHDPEANSVENITNAMTIPEKSADSQCEDESYQSATPAPTSPRKRGIDDVTLESSGDTMHVKKQKVDHFVDGSDEEGVISSAGPSPDGMHPQSSVAKIAMPTNDPEEKARKKRDLYLKRAQQAFNREIGRLNGEELNEQFVARTISALVRCSSAFLVSHPEHVSKLCSHLSKAYRDNDVSPTLVLKGILRVFRVPRARKKLQNASIGICELCQRVLLDTMSTSEVQGEGVYVELDHCLDMLRDMVIEYQPPLDNAMPSDGDSSAQLKLVADWRAKTSSTTATTDKNVLIQVCTLHALLCRSASLLRCSRVLLFEVLCCNPNIKGLLLASAMVEVSPELLVPEFDSKYQERKMILKDTLMYALVVITSITSVKQQELFNESGVEMLHRILRAIQSESLDGVDGTDPSYQRRFATQISNAVFAASDEDMASEEALLQVGKSLELIAAVHGADYLAREFRLILFRELFDEYVASSNQIGLARAIGALRQVVSAIISCRSKVESSGIAFVEDAAEWLIELLEAHRTVEARAWQMQCALTAADLATGATMLDVTRRRRSLLAVVNWFENQPPEWLMELPAGSLRKIRVAVLTALPLLRKQ